MWLNGNRKRFLILDLLCQKVRGGKSKNQNRVVRGQTLTETFAFLRKIHYTGNSFRGMQKQTQVGTSTGPHTITASLMRLRFSE